MSEPTDQATETPVQSTQAIPGVYDPELATMAPIPDLVIQPAQQVVLEDQPLQTLSPPDPQSDDSATPVIAEAEEPAVAEEPTVGPDLFDRKLGATIIGTEGGYSNNPNDAGGETNWGITFKTARSNGYIGPMKDMPRSVALSIYKREFYLATGVYLIAPLSETVAAEIFDTGVNMGPGIAAKFLQRALNALNRCAQDYPDINVDGAIGPGTARALASFLKFRVQHGEQVMLRALNALQGAHYIELCEAREADEAFAYGWLENRVGIN